MLETVLNHAIIRFGSSGTIYDPSYARKFNTLAEWEDTALDAVIYKDTNGNLDKKSD